MWISDSFDSEREATLRAGVESALAMRAGLMDASDGAG
jgi:hypothetical protein